MPVAGQSTGDFIWTDCITCDRTHQRPANSNNLQCDHCMRNLQQATCGTAAGVAGPKLKFSVKK